MRDDLDMNGVDFPDAGHFDPARSNPMGADAARSHPSPPDAARSDPRLAGEGPSDPRSRAGFALADAVRLGFRAGFVAVLLLAVGWAAGGLRQVPPDSRAVVQRFGQIERVREAGLVLAWPAPIEQITLVPAYDRQVALKVAVPLSSGPSAETDFQIHQPDDVVTIRRQKDAWNGQYFLTGDGSVVRFDGTIYYRVTDPAAYVLSRDHVEPALQRLYRASAAMIAARYDLNDFLVARPEDSTHPVSAEVAGRRQALRGELVLAINRRLAALQRDSADLGVEVSRIDFVALLPPLAKAAFDDVLTASQIADQTAAAARTDAAHIIQNAQRADDRSRSEAAAAAEEQVRLAASETADVGLLHAEITPANRDSLLAQYYRDRIGAVLRKIGHVTTVDMRGGQPVIIQGPDE
ncbi:MAG TPA: SPFH domain-containing protein [Rhodopila sp.]